MGCDNSTESVLFERAGASSPGTTDISHYEALPKYGLARLHFACRNDSVALARKTIFDDHQSLQYLDRSSHLPLLVATRAKARNVVEFLLRDCGDDPNLPAPRTKNTAMHTAALKGDFEIFRLLLSYGGVPTARNADGKTALDLLNGPERSLLSSRLLLQSRQVEPLKESDLAAYLALSSLGGRQALKRTFSRSSSIDRSSGDEPNLRTAMLPVEGVVEVVPLPGSCCHESVFFPGRMSTVAQKIREKQNKAKNHRLSQLLQCPIDFEPYHADHEERIPYSCATCGQTLCASCKVKLKKCPFCTAPWETSPRQSTDRAASSAGRHQPVVNRLVVEILRNISQ